MIVSTLEELIGLETESRELKGCDKAVRRDAKIGAVIFFGWWN
jgi:hypothetical protein